VFYLSECEPICTSLRTCNDLGGRTCILWPDTALISEEQHLAETWFKAGKCHKNVILDITHDGRFYYIKLADVMPNLGDSEYR
jgi:hypothetical protein